MSRDFIRPRACAQTKRTIVDDARNKKTRKTSSDERKFRCSFDSKTALYGEKRETRNANVLYSILDYAVTQS